MIQKSLQNFQKTPMKNSIFTKAVNVHTAATF